jgi:RNA polymerase sigma factor (sigma-70 family)
MEQLYIKYRDKIELYFQNDAKKLYNMVDKILQKLRFNVDKSDFYSLGNEIFIDVLKRYDEIQDFDGFLYSCLEKKFKTEMTRRTRDKRCIKTEVVEKDLFGNKVVKKVIVPEVRLDAPLNDEDEETTIGDVTAGNNTVESEVFKEEKREEWKSEVKEYLDNLSPLQRKIAFLLSDNNTPDEICEELHITMKHFDNSLKRILADERIGPLRSLVERN